ncbi:MAG: hypothetical protein DRI28_06690 [Caldiserica bacterium]|nr:MAG: hypothetical protein DRI28_06690 [Caldisericota bacterium]
MSPSLEYDLTVFGSFSFDLIEHPSGEKVRCAGGSGNYFSLSAYLAGASVVPVGYLSSGIKEDVIKKIEKKLPLIYLKRDGDISFHIRYDENWNDHYLKDIDRDIEIFDYKTVPETPFVHVAVISDERHQLEILKFFKERGSFVSSGTYLLRIKRNRMNVLDTIDVSDIFFLNKLEALTLSGSNSFDDALSFFSRMNKMIVITKGKDGAVFVKGEKIYEVSCVQPERVRDVTGAGESFAGGFIGSFIRFRDPLLSLKFGSTLSSFVIEDFGINRLLKIERSDVLKRLEEAYHD